MVVVVVCNVTGRQGRAIVARFQELRARQKSIRVTIRGLTRNKNSQKAKRLLEGLQNKDLLKLYDVDYDDASSFTQAFESADALLLNVIMSKEESQQYRNILTAALAAKTIRHVIYSSNTECQLDHGIPHWETSWKTEQYLEKLASYHPELTYHVLRYAHCNDNLLSFYRPGLNDTTIYVPWDPSVPVHTASVKDGARVACKLFLDPSLLPHGHKLDVVTDFCSPHNMAAAVSLASGGTTVEAYKGPWLLLNVSRPTGPKILFPSPTRFERCCETRLRPGSHSKPSRPFASGTLEAATKPAGIFPSMQGDFKGPLVQAHVGSSMNRSRNF
jgi:hypothetical protein